ncbi:MAG: futalosine hydrolase [Phycisphaerales bacterium]|nr:futalosine hydrolase [Phycisphaerales bacterium]
MLLLVAAVEQEARAIGQVEGAHLITTGIGPANAAAAVAAFLVQHPHVSCVANVGVSGLLPGAGLQIGDVAYADPCVDADLGMVTPDGFKRVAQMGFDAGLSERNALNADPTLAAVAANLMPGVPVASVVTCSGTHERAAEVAARTGAAMEAMEGVAVLRAAARAGVPAIEIRAASNTTGDRNEQVWELPKALEALAGRVRAFVDQVT